MNYKYLLIAWTLVSSLFSFAEQFPFNPPKNFSLFFDKGLVVHPVTTKNPEAQAYFNQGLALVYGFNHDAAFWSFKRASELDPNLAMAFWGMALALGPNINMDITKANAQVAFDLTQKALQLSATATENEKGYIRALSKRYVMGREAHKTAAKEYFEAMKQVMFQFPDDLDAATLFAESGLDLNPWKQWDENQNPREHTLEIVHVLESVIKRDPNHLGANHYYIHAMEASKHPERALMSAERLRAMATDLGHILHMPGHIYLLVGDYHLAAACNEKAVASDRAYIKQYGMDGIYPLHYLSHNLYFLSRAYSMEGRFEDAKRAADELYSFYAPYFQEMPNLEYYIPTPLFVLLRYHRWQEILNQPPPDKKMQNAYLLWHFARGMAFAAQNNLTQALEEQKNFLDGREKLLPDGAFGYNTAATILDLADLTLKAKIAEAKKDVPASVQYLKQAIAIQDALNYNEPPDWAFSIREALGGVLLRNEQYREAELVFREDLERHPRNGRSLFGLLETLKAQSRHTDAFWVQREFEDAWQYSTTALNVEDL